MRKNKKRLDSFEKTIQDYCNWIKNNKTEKKDEEKKNDKGKKK